MDSSHKRKKAMPIPSELREQTLKDSTLDEISDVLDIFESGNLKNFNAQTNVNLNNKCVVFDVDENDIGKTYLPAFLFLVVDIVYSISKENRLTYDAIILDEIWKMLINRMSAMQIQELVKLIRGYGACTIMATQDVIDFTNNDFGEAVISNSQLKFFFKLEDNEIENLSRIINLTEQDKADISSLSKGHCLFLSNGDKAKLQIVSSQNELETFTTDINLLRKINKID